MIVIDYTKYSGHTPGPWKRTDSFASKFGAPEIEAGTCWRSQPRRVATAWFHSGSEDPEVGANAALIKDAPDLLARCRDLEAENKRLRIEAERLRAHVEDLNKDLADAHKRAVKAAQATIAKTKGADQ